MNYSSALSIAEDLIKNINNHCLRAEIAGSLRRHKSKVGDIEICVIPKDELIDLSNWIPGQLVKNGPRYKNILLPEGINLDFFIVLPPAQWGVIFTIRTGSADFSKWIVTTRKYGGCLPSDSQVRDGCVYRHGEIVPMPEEQDFLDFLGLGWVDPTEREDVTALIERIKNGHGFQSETCASDFLLQKG